MVDSNIKQDGKNSPDRRVTERAALRPPEELRFFSVTIQAGPDDKLEGFVLDVSENGLGIALSRKPGAPPAPGQLIKGELRGNFRDPFKFSGVIAWIDLGLNRPEVPAALGVRFDDTVVIPDALIAAAMASVA